MWEKPINSIIDGEKQLLDRASAGDAAAAKSLIERYLKLLFSFVISFAPFGREQAFHVTVASFVRAFQKYPRVAADGEWLQALFRETLGECARVVPSGGMDLRKEPLRTVHQALLQLSLSDKTLLLLRDQCHFSFETIAAILGSTAQESRLTCLAARERLRATLGEILQKPGAANGV